MSVYKITNKSSVNAQSKREILVGSLTSKASSLSRVADGRKIDGVLEAGRDTMRVGLVKQDDCQAEFVCHVRGLDTQGREVIGKLDSATRSL